MNYDSLTLTFKIEDKEKFREFHKKIFCSVPEKDAVVAEIGGHAIVSSWSNPFDEIDKLKAALEYARRELNYEESKICKLISEGKTEEEAEIEVEESL